MAQHEHATTPVPNDLARLRILLPHWIEHNDEHAEGFREWAAKARELGLEAVAEQLEVAAEQMAAGGQSLTTALQKLEKQGQVLPLPTGGEPCISQMDS